MFHPYLPIFLSAFISMITILIASRFEEVERKESIEKMSLSETAQNIKEGFHFIFHSKRLKSFFLFTAFFTGFLMMISTYEKSLLKDLQFPSQYFGIVFALLTIVQCIGVRYQDKIHRAFKNKTLAFLSIPVFLSFIFIGLISSINLNSTITFLVIIFGYFIQHFLRAPYWVLETKYLTNFTTSSLRTKLLAVDGILEGLGRTFIMFLGGLLLEYFNTRTSYFIIGFLGLILILLILRYMKTRIGLSPENYDKNDIKLES